MKAIKYIISFFILFIGILIIGESHTFYLNNFYTEFYSTSMYLQPNTTDKEMIQDIVTSSHNNKVDVFIFIRSPKSTFLTEYNIFGTLNVEKNINANLHIFEQEYKSIFLGKTKFTFNDFKDIDSMYGIHDFYIIGSKENIKSFKMELIDKYAGNHPKEGYYSNELKYTVVFIWVLIIFIVLLLTFYDVTSQKKEAVIRVSMGEPIKNIIWKNIICDSLFFTFFLVIILFTLSKYTYTLFEINISIVLFICLLIMNSLLYLNLRLYNFKEIFSNSKGSKKLLSLNYILKVFSIIVTIFIISSNIALIFDSYSLYRQKSFFQDYSDYSYTRLGYKPYINSDGSRSDTLSKSAEVQASFYSEFFNKFDARLLANISNLLKAEGILSNKNSYDYLSHKIKEFQKHELNKDFYFLLPRSMSNDTKIINKIKEAIRFYESENLKYDFEVIYYKDNVEIVSIDENYAYGSELIKNPVIIFNNMADEKITDHNNDMQKLNYVSDIMYKISEDDLNQFIKEHKLDNQIVTLTNVFEKYENKWLIAKRILYMNIIFSILVLLLEIIIVSSIIRLEYEVNAIILVIKKIMGYSLFEKHKKLILITIIPTIFSILLSVIIAMIMKVNEPYCFIVGGTIILSIELILIIFNILRTEKSNLQKILKGGSL